MCKKILHLFYIFVVLVFVGCSGKGEKAPLDALSTPTKTQSPSLISAKPLLPTVPTFQQTPTTPLAAAWDFDKKTKIAFAFFQLGNTGIYSSSLSEKLTLEHPVSWSKIPSFYRHPTWSPDGKSLAFELDRGDGTRIYIADQDGTNLRALTSQVVAVLSEPDWSPDNNYIAFTTGLELYIIKPDGTGLKKLASQRTLSQPTWSSDGKYIAFLADSKADFSGATINIIDENGENLRILAGPRIANILSGISWSPDNQKIVFGSVVDGCRDISIVDVASGETNHFIASLGFDKDPVWSPDGQHIVFSSGNEVACGDLASRSPYGSYQLFVADVNSGALSPAISPEGAIEPALWPLVSIKLGWTYQTTELGKNLNVRQSPSLSSPKLDSLKSQEKFSILDGPIIADGYQWWKIKVEQDETIGWIVDVPGWYIFESASSLQH